MLEMRVFRIHFLTTSEPKFFLLGIVIFGGDNPQIAEEFL
jgi:hypothetical protein